MKVHGILVPASVVVAMAVGLYGYGYFTLENREPVTAYEVPAVSDLAASAPKSVPEHESRQRSETAPESKPILQVEAESEAESGEWIPESASAEPYGEAYAYSEQVPSLFKERRDNIATFISRDDLPSELQIQLDEALESNRRNGYLHTSEAYIEHMSALYAEIVPLDLSDPRIMIEVENIERTPLAELRYIGAIPDQIPGMDNMPIPGVRRLFEHEAGHLSLYEANLASSEALLQKEFVNQSVKDYPATQITYCAPSDRCVTQLVWLTENKRYELSLSGDIKEFGEDKLVAIASTLDLPDAKKPSKSQKN